MNYSPVAPGEHAGLIRQGGAGSGGELGSRAVAAELRRTPPVERVQVPGRCRCRCRAGPPGASIESVNRTSELTVPDLTVFHVLAITILAVHIET